MWIRWNLTVLVYLRILRKKIHRQQLWRNQIPEEVKQDRQAELMELQQEISLERGESCVGKDYLVMIEGKVADENAYVGRTYADATGIDGYMFINTGELLMSGDFVKAHVTGSLEYDLIGEIADEYTE